MKRNKERWKKKEKNEEETGRPIEIERALETDGQSLRLKEEERGRERGRERDANFTESKGWR